MDRYLSPREASELTGLALQTLANRRNRKAPPAYVKIGANLQSRIRYPLSSLEEFLSSENPVRRYSPIPRRKIAE